MIGLQEHGIELDCGETRNAEAPDTFDIPCKAMRMNVGEGWFVKLIFIGRAGSTDDLGAERMWVKVTESTGEGYRGTLANQPFCDNLAPLEWGSSIEFASENIVDIMDDSDIQENA
tara:strand:- start:1216 stop:1563 length:348 start_codon:yes stop_codon:yes gene_type:complete